MKKILYTLFVTTLLSGVSYAQESQGYCEKNCSPKNCTRQPSWAAVCMDACPHMFQSCYEAIPDEEKPRTDEAIEKVEQGLAAADPD